MNSFQIVMLIVLVAGIGGGFALLTWGINKLRQAEEDADDKA